MSRVSLLLTTSFGCCGHSSQRRRSHSRKISDIVGPPSSRDVLGNKQIWVDFDIVGGCDK